MSAAFAARVTDLIERRGQIGQLGTKGPNTGPDYAPVFSYTWSDLKWIEAENEITNRPGFVSQVGDVSGFISAESIVTHEHKLRLRDFEYTIAELMPVQPGATLISYQFLARK